MEFKTLPGLTPDGQIYFDEEMAFLEAMLPPGPWATAHGPGLVETPAGTLLCCWFAGTFEGDTDVNIVVSRLEKGSDQWGEPAMISTDNEFSNQNPSLFLAAKNEIWCLYTSQRGREPGKDNMQYTSVIKRQISRDDGRTWSAPEVVLPEEGTFARQPIQVLSNGRWIYGLWLCSDGASGLAGDPSAFAVSDDAGATWRRVDVPASSGRVHPSVVELEEGHLVAFMRSREADWIYRSESADYGDTWSAPEPTPLPNNNSGIAVAKLASGRIAIASARVVSKQDLLLKVWGASPSRTTTTPRRAPTARRGRGRRCATPFPSRSPRTAASRSRSSATWSAARGTWARRTSSTTASTSTPASCRRLTA